MGVLRGLLFTVLAVFGLNSYADVELPSSIQFLSDFETGAIQHKKEPVDGWREQHANNGKFESNNKTYAVNIIKAGEMGLSNPRHGIYAARFEVRPGDNPLAGDFNPRAQLRQGVNLITQGITHYIGFSVWIPSGFDARNQHIAQFFSESDKQQTGTYGPFWKIVLSDNKWRIKALWQEDDRANPLSKGKSTVKTGGHGATTHRLDRDKWTDFVVEIRFDNANGKRGNGLSRVWKDGELIADWSGGPLGPPNGKGPMSFLLDVYGQPPSGGHHVYFDAVRISNEKIGRLQDVDPAGATSARPRPPKLVAK